MNLDLDRSHSFPPLFTKNKIIKKKMISSQREFANTFLQHWVYSRHLLRADPHAIPFKRNQIPYNSLKSTKLHGV